MKVVTPEIAWHETLPIYSCDLQPLASSSSAGADGGTVGKAPNREPLKEILLAELEARDQKTGKAPSDSTEQQQTDASWTRLATAGGDNMVRLWRVQLDWTPPSAVRVAAPTGRLSRGLLQSGSVADAAAAAKKSSTSSGVVATTVTTPTVCTTAAVSDGLVFLSTLRRHERLVNVVVATASHLCLLLDCTRPEAAEEDTAYRPISALLDIIFPQKLAFVKSILLSLHPPLGAYLASAGDDQFVIIWSMHSKSSEPTESKSVSTGADDADDPSSVEIWLPCRSLRRVPWPLKIKDIYDLCWSPDEAFLLSGSVDHSAILWQLDLAPSSVGQEGVPDQASAANRESGSLSTALKTVILRDHKHYVQGVAWDPLGDFVATMSSDRTCRIYRAGSKNCYANICKAGKQNLFQDDSWKSFFRRPAFSPDGLLLVCPAGNLESAVFAGDVASAVSFAAAAASNGGVTISSKVDEVNKTPLLLPSTSPIAPQHCAHIFLRGAYARPCISLPTGNRPVVAVRFCPQAFQLRLLAPRPGVTCTSAIDLPYRLLFCLVLEDGLLFYDTQQVNPFAQVSQIHYQALNDATWSSDARFVVTSSTDGYCSFIYFQVEELGKPYHGPLGIGTTSTTPLSKTVTTQRAEIKLPAAEVSAAAAPEPMDVSAETQPHNKDRSETEKSVTALTTSEVLGKCPMRKHISFQNCASVDTPHASLPVTPNTGRFLSTSALTPTPGAARPAVKTVHPPAGTKRRVPFITICGADVVASKSNLEKAADSTAATEKPESCGKTPPPIPQHYTSQHLHLTYGIPSPWDPSQVWWYTQGRLLPHQPFGPTLASGLLDSVMTPGLGSGCSCGSSKLVLLSGQPPGNRRNRWAKPGEGLRCCVCLHTRYERSVRREEPVAQSIHRSPYRCKQDSLYGSRRLVQQRLREMQDAWMTRKAEEIQGFADRNEWKNFFAATKAVYGPHVKGAAPLLSADGRPLLIEKTQILKRWAEHFQSVLNQLSTICDATIDRLPEVEINADLDCPPSLQETIRAVQQLSSRKAPDSDVIPTEICKHGGPQLVSRLTVLFQKMWHRGQFPQDFKYATIAHLYKKKGNRQLCDNQRRISLLNIAGKIFVCILLHCLNAHLEQGLHPENLVNRCLGHRHTAEMAVSTALTVLAHSLITLAYSVTCAYSTTCEIVAWKAANLTLTPDHAVGPVYVLFVSIG
ncbi:unnamed protein product [Schistocephalus solidus]|uniref:WD_REPEATS_REGION domain-containing protein n=1 Tax=Schistocephalus solidus TaxID=70667 RepID=A0A183SQC7_SCHSO|nr:unnamed protein product [Schistocephalus solidus]